MDIQNPLKQKLDAELASTDASVNLNMALSKWLNHVTALLILIRAWWSPRWDGEVKRETPAFESLGLDESIVDESDYLVAELWEWSRSFRNVPQAARDELVKQAQRILAEVRGFARWLALDHPDLQFALDTLSESEQRLGRSLAEFATRLEGLHAVVAPYRDTLDGMAGFDASTIDACESLALALRAKPDAVRYREGRNRMIAMLRKRVTRLQQAGGLVFREHPHLAAELSFDVARRRAPQEEPEPEVEVAEVVEAAEAPPEAADDAAIVAEG